MTRTFRASNACRRRSSRTSLLARSSDFAERPHFGGASSIWNDASKSYSSCIPHVLVIPHKVAVAVSAMTANIINARRETEDCDNIGCICGILQPVLEADADADVKEGEDSHEVISAWLINPDITPASSTYWSLPAPTSLQAPSLLAAGAPLSFGSSHPSIAPVIASSSSPHQKQSPSTTSYILLLPSTSHPSLVVVFEGIIAVVRERRTQRPRQRRRRLCRRRQIR